LPVRWERLGLGKRRKGWRLVERALPAGARCEGRGLDG
jgi:hypothetical protein